MQMLSDALKRISTREQLEKRHHDARQRLVRTVSGTTHTSDRFNNFPLQLQQRRMVNAKHRAQVAKHERRTVIVSSGGCAQQHLQPLKAFSPSNDRFVSAVSWSSSGGKVLPWPCEDLQGPLLYATHCAVKLQKLKSEMRLKHCKDAASFYLFAA